LGSGAWPNLLPTMISNTVCEILDFEEMKWYVPSPQ
jgi:hypothetical protein